MLAGGGEGMRRILVFRPADPGERGPRLVEVEIGDAQDMDAGRPDRLGEIHRSELAGPDQADPDRLLLRRAGGTQLVQVRVRPLLEARESASGRAVTRMCPSSSVTTQDRKRVV